MNERTLHERYHELHALRGEALERYGRLPYPQTGGPPAKAYFPAIGRRLDPYKSVRFGPLVVSDYPPIVQVVLSEFARLPRPVRVLEIGPGRGALAALVRERFPNVVTAYLGMELDPHVEGPYARIARFDEIDKPVDVVIASEVIEHIPAEAFYADYLRPLARILAPDALLLASIPNPLAPGGIVRDFTHVQNYPWYDLYALLRLAFERVEITKTHYICNASRFFGLLPRMLLTSLQELDWTEGLIAIARRPIPPV
ncbi:MAG TPA: methyltransferase domain-containing protein [Verrucomicrobiae bacterium]|jgi:SAM-dependent methyltransferase|nr:methyltransferase domain-containing protein [Verrucomicrobiae bacterium]